MKSVKQKGESNNLKSKYISRIDIRMYKIFIELVEKDLFFSNLAVGALLMFI